MGNNKLREIREKRKLSQLQLSFLSRVPNCVISDIERGVRKPWPKARKDIAQALGLPERAIFPSDNGNKEV